MEKKIIRNAKLEFANAKWVSDQYKRSYDSFFPMPTSFIKTSEAQNELHYRSLIRQLPERYPWLQTEMREPVCTKKVVNSYNQPAYALRHKNKSCILSPYQASTISTNFPPVVSVYDYAYFWCASRWGPTYGGPANQPGWYYLNDHLCFSETGQHSVVGYYSGDVVLPDDDQEYEHLVDLAFTAALSESRTGVYEASADIAEFRETANFFHDTAKLVGPELRNLRRLWRSIKNPKRALRDYRRFVRKYGLKAQIPYRYRDLHAVASYWLYYRYAVMPLYLSLKDVMEALDYKKVEWQTFRSSETVERSSIISKDGLDLHVATKIVGRGFVRNRYTDGRRAISAWLPTGVWEAVPFSFIADWFVNIGDYLQSLKPIDALQYGYGSLKTVTTIQARRELPERDHGFAYRPLNHSVAQEVYKSTIPSSVPAFGVGNSKQSLLLYETVIEDYFGNPRDCKPVLVRDRTSLSTKRLLDSVALSYKLLLK